MIVNGGPNRPFNDVKVDAESAGTSGGFPLHWLLLGFHPYVYGAMLFSLFVPETSCILYQCSDRTIIALYIQHHDLNHTNGFEEGMLERFPFQMPLLQ